MNHSEVISMTSRSPLPLPTSQIAADSSVVEAVVEALQRLLRSRSRRGTTMKALSPFYAFIYIGAIFAEMTPTCEAFNHKLAEKFGIVHPQMRRVHVSRIAGLPPNAWQELSRDPHFLLELPNLSYLCSSMQLMQRANGGKPSSSYHLWSNGGIPTARLQSMVAAMDMLCMKITALPLDYATSRLQEKNSTKSTNSIPTRSSTTETPTNFAIFRGGRSRCRGKHPKIQTSTMKARFPTKPELKVATNVEHTTLYGEIGNKNIRERNSSEQSQNSKQPRNKSQSEKHSSFDEDELKYKNNGYEALNNETEIIKPEISVSTTPTITEYTTPNQNTQSIEISETTEFYELETSSLFERETTEVPTTFKTTEFITDARESQTTTWTNESTTNIDSTDRTIPTEAHDFKGHPHTREYVTSRNTPAFTTTEETKYAKRRETTLGKRIFESSVTTKTKRYSISENEATYSVTPETILKAKSVSELDPVLFITTADHQSSTVSNSSVFMKISLLTTESNISGSAPQKMFKDTNYATKEKKKMDSVTEEFDEVFNQDLTHGTKLITQSLMQMEPKPLRMIPVSKNFNPYHVTQPPNGAPSVPEELGRTGRHPNQEDDSEASSTTLETIEFHQTRESALNISPDQEVQQETHLPRLESRLTDRGYTSIPRSSLEFQMSPTKGTSLPSENILKVRAKNGEITESKWDAMNKYALAQLLNTLGVKSPKIKFKKRPEVKSI